MPRHLNPRLHWAPTRTHGAGTLPVVLILLLSVTLLMLYSHRALIAEQRAVANQVRAAWAMEAAEAGRAWALAALNRSGRVDDACQPVSPGAASQPGLRERLLTSDAGTGRVDPLADRGAACVLNGEAVGSWRCACPPDAPPQLGSAADGRNHPAFRVRLEAGPTADGVAGVLRLVVTGCSHLSEACDGAGAAGAPAGGDASTELRSLIAPLGQLLRPPASAVTARGAVHLGATVTLVNGDASSGGLTAQSGSAIQADAGARLLGPPGRPTSATLLADDPQLAGAGGAAEDGFWRRHFGLSATALRELPTLQRIACPSGGCGAAEVQAALDAGHRALWLQGDWQLSAPVAWRHALGLLLLVDGQVRWQGAQEIDALLVARDISWQHAGGGVARLRGALMSLGAVELGGPVEVVRDAALLERLRGTLGVYASVPGSWQDFVNR